jgi:hypothetical protein
MWAFLKPWIDPVTASKIQILPSSKTLSTLTEFIAPENIPVRFGGMHDFDVCMCPTLDKTILQAADWTLASEATLPPGPLKWKVDADGCKVASAVGSADGQLRNNRIAVWKPNRKDSKAEPESSC